ncbi:MAG: hypothetical protein IPK07_27700 [Deltaproteobacteria bacterium]|nr:hypothetical protein [Deltaproteobacteria bacterium]
MLEVLEGALGLAEIEVDLGERGLEIGRLRVRHRGDLEPPDRVAVLVEDERAVGLDRRQVRLGVAGHRHRRLGGRRRGRHLRGRHRRGTAREGERREDAQRERQSSGWNSHRDGGPWV